MIDSEGMAREDLSGMVFSHGLVAARPPFRDSPVWPAAVTRSLQHFVTAAKNCPLLAARSPDLTATIAFAPSPAIIAGARFRACLETLHMRVEPDRVRGMQL
jgi:hypothetical protein